MVRFHWHVEHGISAHCPRGPCALVEGGVRHIEAESDVAGQKETLPLIFTVPPAYLSDGRPGRGRCLGAQRRGGVAQHAADRAGCCAGRQRCALG